MLKSLLRTLKHIINAATRLLPGYQYLVLKYCSIGSTQHRPKLLWRLIQSAFFQQYWTLPVGERSDAQKRLMGDAHGVNWANHYQAFLQDQFPPSRGTYNVGELDFHDANPIYEKVDDYLDGLNHTCAVIQLGASSGKEIAYFAQKHPGHIFYYSDIYDSVTAYASSVHQHSNLNFFTASAEYLHIIASLTDARSVLVFSAGSSQYVYPEHLDLMFQRLSSLKEKEIIFALSEPADNIAINPLTFEGSQPRGNFSYTHNYSYYALKYGFEQLEWRMISPYPLEQYPERWRAVQLFGIFRQSQLTMAL
jgi:hypothetical protein